MLRKTIKGKNHNLFNLAPTKMLVLSFAILILIGTFLLSMPFSSRNGDWTPLIDAFFTATSSACITGFIVYDTYAHWSTIGQCIILAMVQIGALGIITLATFFSLLLKKKVGLKGMILAQESINSFGYFDVLKLIRNIITVTFAIELIGAIILSFSFVPKFGAFGFYMAIFYSISAFCNAGFDITSAVADGHFLSITPFNGDSIIIYTLSLLVIVGGLGFTVWKDLYEYKKNRKLLFHTKLVLLLSAFFILSGTIFFFFNEFNNPKTMGSMSIPEKINASFFQSSAARSSGFSSIILTDMKDISQVFTIILMFIGAAPGSTGGGVKVTTIGILLVAIFSQIRGGGDIILFKRKVMQNTVNKALSITGLSILVILTITTVIATIQPEFGVLEILYETTSAFGTTGLTLETTHNLNIFSKLLIALTMFLGRVGPLSFAVALTLKVPKRASELVYPEAKILVG